MRVVVRITSFSIFMLKRRLTMVRIRPPAAPTEAASVGEAMPRKMEPRTPMMSTRAGIRAMVTRLSACARNAASSAAGTGGASSGRTCESTVR